jgi:tannase
MRFTSALAAVASIATAANAATLGQVCTTSNVQAALPADGFYNGITIDSTSVTASPVYNTSVSGNYMYPDGTFDYCNGRYCSCG